MECSLHTQLWVSGSAQETRGSEMPGAHPGSRPDAEVTALGFVASPGLSPAGERMPVLGGGGLFCCLPYSHRPPRACLLRALLPKVTERLGLRAWRGSCESGCDLCSGLGGFMAPGLLAVPCPSPSPHAPSRPQEQELPNTAGG